MIKIIKKIFKIKEKTVKEKIDAEEIPKTIAQIIHESNELSNNYDIHHNKEKIASLKKECIDSNFQRKASSDVDKSLISFATDSALVNAMDSSCSGFGDSNRWGYSPAQFNFFAQQSFFGWQLSAMLAQHWLIDKACSIPGEHAVRNGYEVTVNSGIEISTEILDKIRELDKKYKVKENLIKYEKFCLVFGIRIALFKIENKDPQYYELLFDPDGITPGSYKGIVQIDPNWCSPVLTGEDAYDPSSLDFYNPTYWIIGGKRYHRSHLIVCRTKEVADILKPTYFYGGVPKPQEIFERVYQAERAANESTLLLFSKRSKFQKIDITAAMMKQGEFEKRMAWMDNMQTSFSTKFIDMKEDAIQFDTSLSDLDNVIMNQYQLAAGASEVPAVLLYETEPKGFQSTGALSIKNWMQRLSDIQNNDLTPLLDRHHLCLIRSEICPNFGIDGKSKTQEDQESISPFYTTIKWNPLDEPTEKEQSEINKINAETDSILINAGIVEQDEARKGLILNPSSRYTGIKEENIELEERNKIVNENPELEEEGQHEEFSRPSVYS